jgi:hypothetical protein
LVASVENVVLLERHGVDCMSVGEGGQPTGGI